MTDFLWSSPAGAVDFAVMMLVAAIVLALGRPWARGAALIVVAVFLAERTIIATAPAHLWPVFGGAAELAALWVALHLPKSRARNAYAALYFVKMAVYLTVAARAVDLEVMKAAATVAAGLQLLLLLAGVPWGGLFNGLRGRGTHRHAVRGSGAAVAQRTATE